MLLDDQNLIDLGPDAIAACVDMGISLANLKNVFLTHTHTDHFSFANLDIPANAVTPTQTMQYYLSKQAYEGIQQVCAKIRELNFPALTDQLEKSFGCFCFHPLDAFTQTEVDDMRVTALPGRHTGYFKDEYSYNYLFEKNGKSVYYASDTGAFLQETEDYLAACYLSVLVIETTFGMTELRKDEKHLNVNHLLQQLSRLTTNGTIDRGTEVIITHVAHKGGCNLDLEPYLQEHYTGRIKVAYDGMCQPISW